jgi:hypothetical protein
MGPPGKDGYDGTDGKDGKDGADGSPGVGVHSAELDLDGHLVLKLTDGSEIDCGEIWTLPEKKQGTKVALLGNIGGGDLDLNNNAMTATFTAASALTAGDICHLDSSGEMEKADASAEATAKSMLTIATQTLSQGDAGTFLIKGNYAIGGFTAGDTLFLSTGAGQLIQFAPSNSGEITRVVGYATSGTTVFFDPDKSWFEIN